MVSLLEKIEVFTNFKTQSSFNSEKASQKSLNSQENFIEKLRTDMKKNGLTQIIDEKLLLIELAKKGEKSMIRLALKLGANVNVQMVGDEDPLAIGKKSSLLHYLAAKFDDNDFIKECVNYGAYINQSNANKRTPLHSALQKRKENVARSLIDSGVSVNYPDKDGMTPFQVCALVGFHSLIKPCLESGAKINQKDNSGKTSLHLITGKYANDEKIKLTIKALLENGANVNIQDNLGKKPLHITFNPLISLRDDYREELAVLHVKNGANVNLQDNYGQTPLHITLVLGAMNGRYNEELVKLHDENGADVHIEDNGAWSPLKLVETLNTNSENKMIILNLLRRNM